jgi:hypothetical protein
MVLFTVKTPTTLLLLATNNYFVAQVLEAFF